MADAPKTPPPTQALEAGTEFIKNPSGVIHDVEGEDREDGRPPHPSVALAKKDDGGWRFASAEEIREYCKIHNLEVPGLRSRENEIKKAQAEGEELKAQEIAAIDAAVAAVDAAAAPVAEPEPKPAKKSRSKSANK